MIDLAYSLIKPILFTMDPETAHQRVLSLVGGFPRLARAMTPNRPPPASLACEVAGLRLPSPIGLAAGLDKEAEALLIWDRLGFGFVEIGTITPRPQPGNARPRVHRLPQHRAVVNSMGFPSSGCEAVTSRLKAWKAAGTWPTVPVGVNLGKNKDTPSEDAWKDYAHTTERMVGLADYFTVNVSSPNTPGLRDLQMVEPLKRILSGVLEVSSQAPVFVKLAPDMDDEDLQRSVEAAISTGVSGIIATNTTRQRMGIAEAEALTGGLSGAPLYPLAKDRILKVLEVADGRVPVIGVGGIHSAAQARELLDAGCAALQIYSALIFEGPGLISRINRELARG